MDVTEIPYAKHTGISKNDEGRLVLVPSPEVENHIKSIHASAQYTLAETQSGDFLQEAFPEYVGKVAGLLREANVKYKHPALTTLTAYASIDDKSKVKFLTQLEKKSRAGITILVNIKDEKGTITMSGAFSWFVQKLA